MKPDEACERLKDWKWIKQGISGIGVCPLSNGKVHKLAVSTTSTACLGSPKCSNEAIEAFFATHTNGGAAPTSQDLVTRPTELDQWRTHVWVTLQGTLRDEPSFFRRDAARIVVSIGNLVDTVPYLRPPPDLSRTDAEEELDKIVNDFIAAEVPAVQERGSLDIVNIDWEDHATALVANQEYLTHKPIIEGLCYAKTASLLVGGKHSGKTTNARTIAMSVCRGMPVFGRQTMPGAVLYCASEDEVLVVRSELLRMGWCPDDQLSLMKIGGKTLADPERLLDAICLYSQQKRAVLIILDMLFDFAGIKDEMSYAGTREAAGKVYDLAMRTDADAGSTGVRKDTDFHRALS